VSTFLPAAITLFAVALVVVLDAVIRPGVLDAGGSR